MKRLVITGTSSMQAWDEGAQAYARPSRVVSTKSFAQTSDDLRAFDLLPSGCTLPVDILVGNDGNRMRTSRWNARLKTGKLIPGTLWEVGSNRFLTSPEYFFLNVAPRLSVVQAVLLGMELCGYHSTLMSVPYRQRLDELIRNREIGLSERPWPPASWDMSLEHQKDLMDNGFVTRDPIASVPGLTQYLNRALSAKSNSRALVSSRLVAANSRSPMESRLYARYCLPRKYGGFNLRPVELNAEIELPDEIAKASGVTKYSVDLLWPKAHRAIEYQGEHAHGGLTAEERDRLKRNILEATGIRIISIDRKQYANEDMLEFYAGEIAKGMGVFPSELRLNQKERVARYALIDDVTSWDYDLYRPHSKR